jgi:hypothetical protein
MTDERLDQLNRMRRQIKSFKEARYALTDDYEILSVVGFKEDSNDGVTIVDMFNELADELGGVIDAYLKDRIDDLERQFEEA